MTILCAGYGHETNTYAVGTTDLEAFRDSAGDFARLPEIIAAARGTRTILGGCLDEADALGLDCRPVFRAFAVPSGIVTAAAEEALLAELLDRLAGEPRPDALIVPLHGAMVSEAHDDAEGHLLAALREHFGPELPIVVTLDLHANISAAAVRLADVTIGFDLYPHTDMYERGREAMAVAARLAAGELTPAVAYCQLPLITLPPRQCTLIEPMKSILAHLHAIEQRPGVVCGTIAMGFPFADIPDAGVTVLITTTGDGELATACAAELAAHLWAERDRFAPKLTPIERVLEYTYARELGRPVLLADGSDNPGGGAPADGTVLLRALVEAGVRDAVVAAICDPLTAEAAHAAGVGATIEARLGGRTDDRHGEPLECEAYVRLLADGRFRYRAEMSAGAQGNMGPTAVLRIAGVTAVVVSRRHQVWDPEFLRSVGVQPEHQRLIVLKSAVHFRAAFEPLADRVFDADTPGVHRPDFACYRYERLRRPIHPLDAGVDFDPTAAVVRVR